MTFADYGPLAQPGEYPSAGSTRLRDKVAIVTGSTSGIGQATAELFFREGAKVLFTGRGEKEGKAIIAALHDGTSPDVGGEAGFVAADVSRSAEVRKVVQAAVDRWGRIDTLVNNAAMMTFDPIADLEEDDWDKVLEVNLKGPFLFTKFALPHMSEHGAIVNVRRCMRRLPLRTSCHTPPPKEPWRHSRGGCRSSYEIEAFA